MDEARVDTGRRWWPGIILGVLAALILLDRWALCRQFLFKYFDQDQSLLWYAAREFLHGRFHEPCFYGQDYNTCIESYLAAPLLLCGAPYWVALPLVTVVLGLLPFYVIAVIAWRRGQELVAGVSLLLPLILPTTYGMVTGMPRGFVPGLALGIVPAAWMLSAERRKAEGAKWRIIEWRFFWMALLSMLAMVLTANVALLLFPMLIYAVARFWTRLGFWAGMATGTAAGAIFPAYAYVFYHAWHDDYRIQSRDFVYTLSWDNFIYYVRRWPAVFADLTPLWVPADRAAMVLALAVAGMIVYVAIRRRWSLAAASLGGAGMMLVSCGYSRLLFGSASVFYPYSRMFLAAPVVLIWVLLAAGPMRSRWKRWVTLVLLGAMLGVGSWAAAQKYRELPGAIDAAIAENAKGRSPLYVMEVGQLQKLAKTVQAAAEREHATMVLFGGEENRKFDYALPLMTTCETLFTRFERRTWRMYEENHPRHARIMTLDLRVYNAASMAGYRTHIALPPGKPLVFVIETGGESVVEMAHKMDLPLREFDQSK